MKAPAMERHLDNDALVIWRFLVAEGGYWTVREIRMHWEPTYTAAQVRNIIDRLEANGFVREKRRRDVLPKANAAYGVTSACKAPPGYAHMLYEMPGDLNRVTGSAPLQQGATA